MCIFHLILPLKNVGNEPTSNNIIEFTKDAFMYEKKHVNPLLEPKLSTI